MGISEAVEDWSERMSGREIDWLAMVLDSNTPLSPCYRNNGGKSRDIRQGLAARCTGAVRSGRAWRR